MAKYRMKAFVEAEVYKPGMEDGIDGGGQWPPNDPDRPNIRPYVETRRGRIYILEGDYIITDIMGVRHVCNPNVFKKTYELVD